MENLTLAFHHTEHIPLHHFTKKAYLEYSMYVILDRALPHLADGLKPVQRRLIYAMSELGLKNTAKHKKSARTIGDVLGKYHPHGDVACYEALVLMAQPFSYRYPLVDGQGNFGSSDDPKSFAAMRYTESRLSRYADLLLTEVEQGTVEWTPNFDGTLTEPVLLPAQVPNVLLNGTMGIAVGMATDIPPHNLHEILDACLLLLKEPDASLETLLTYIKGPDYPMGGELITKREDIAKIYATGAGSFRVRATMTVEEDNLVITSLPYQTSGAKILEQIAEQMQAKKLPLVSDLRDESDSQTPVRLVITLRSNRVDQEAVMNHLFATTDLEKSYRVNLNMIGLNGRPQVKTLKMILTEWLEFRVTTVRLRLQHRLDKVKQRLHILDGLLIAFLNIDEVIAIIREEDDPKAELQHRFGLSLLQAEAILEIKLRQLAKLEEIKLRAEIDDLRQEETALEAILASDAKLKEQVADELKHIQKEFHEPRRTLLIERDEAKALKTEELLPAEAVTVVLSHQGWIRLAKGHDIDGKTLNYKTGDRFAEQIMGKSNQQVILLGSSGRTYSVLANRLPSARGHGEPLSSYFNFTAGEKIITLTLGDPTQQFLIATNLGYGFITTLTDMLAKNKAGKTFLTLPKGAHPLPPLKLDESDTHLVLVSQQGRVLMIAKQDIPELPKGKGNKLLALKLEDCLQGKDALSALYAYESGKPLTIKVGRKSLKLSSENLAQYQGERGRRGFVV